MISTGVAMRPKAGEKVSGDAAFSREVEGGVLGVIIDVLGHGAEAHRLAIQMTDHLLAIEFRSVGRTITQLHERFQGSRGAAVGLCMVERESGRLHYVGIGNTTTRIFGTNETRLVSLDGVVGGTRRTPVEQQHQLADGDIIAMYSDGVMSHFAEADYPQLRRSPPEDVADGIVRLFGKSHDDASCLVLCHTA